uniref:Uncharacterized protein n=1 Tax=Anguilla anguilla TaxID=7936 RepID=A0A0E9TUD4_ANGAN
MHAFPSTDICVDRQRDSFCCLLRCHKNKPASSLV